MLKKLRGICCCKLLFLLRKEWTQSIKIYLIFVVSRGVSQCLEFRLLVLKLVNRYLDGNRDGGKVSFYNPSHSFLALYLAPVMCALYKIKVYLLRLNQIEWMSSFQLIHHCAHFNRHTNFLFTNLPLPLLPPPLNLLSNVSYYSRKPTNKFCIEITCTFTLLTFIFYTKLDCMRCELTEILWDVNSIETIEVIYHLNHACWALYDDDGLRKFEKCKMVCNYALHERTQEW
jgi:hypothetical protein